MERDEFDGTVGIELGRRLGVSRTSGAGRTECSGSSSCTSTSVRCPDSGSRSSVDDGRQCPAMGKLCPGRRSHRSGEASEQRVNRNADNYEENVQLSHQVDS